MTQPATSFMQPDEVLPLIQQLERRSLDNATPAGPPVWGPAIEKPAFWRVQALARFWNEQKEGSQEGPVDYPQHMGDLLTGLHGQARVFSYLVLGTEQEVGVYLSLHGSQDESTLLRRTLGSIFPGVEISPQAAAGLGVAHNQLNLFEQMGVLTGIPTLKLLARPEEGRGSSQQIERLLRGMGGQRWGYLVQAAAIPQATSLSLAYSGHSQLTRMSALVNQQVSYQGANAQLVQHTMQTASISHDQTNYEAKYGVELLERNLERLQIGKNEGMWQVSVYFFAPTPAQRDQVGAILRAVFSGGDSVPDPVRVFPRATSAGQKEDGYQTLLNSRELAVLCQLPREEFPGYAIRDYARFDTDLHQPGLLHPVALGNILDGSQPTGGQFTIERADLTKHGLIAGVTGSGKTTTVFSLLDRLHEAGRGIPFLVIEPAKTEYRNLLLAGGPNAPRFPNLRVYTLGDERNAPFRLNPFAFAIVDGENRIHVQTHIDFLKAVFNAAFVLYAPMPYVLESCLHEIYTDKGWDLATGINRRLPVAQQGKESQWPVFPTLTDLYEKVDEVVARLGYDERIEMDVQAGLKARIGSLRLGGKGFMLDCAHSVPMQDLLTYPTVLEMTQIGNEDEKAFILGLLLTALYEHHAVQSRLRPASGGGLVHLTVLEEAHRLLKNVSTEVDTEGSNTRGQAVETFTNMLSEIRAYGEGVLIAEQIPTKLAPDAVKNTNLKIVHRLLAGDDRETLAATMNMDEAQSNFLTTLKPGQTVVHAEGADHPYLVQMEDFKSNVKGQVADRKIRQQMAAVTSQPLYDPVPGFSTHFPAQLLQQLTQQNHPLSEVREQALRMVESSEGYLTFDRYLLGIVTKPEQAVYTFGWMKQTALRLWIETDTLMPTVLYAVLLGVHRHSMRRGRQYGWAYHRVSNLYAPLQKALAHLAQNYPYTLTDSTQIKNALDALTAQIGPDLQLFQTNYTKATESQAPFATCQLCQSRCRYRFEAAQIADHHNRRTEIREILKMSVSAMSKALVEECREGALQMVQVSKTQLPRDAIICYAVHAAAAQKLSGAGQMSLVRKVGTLLNPSP